jgi:hypothetical protein
VRWSWTSTTPSTASGRDRPAALSQPSYRPPEDVELALDAAHAAKDAWAGKSATERAAVLNAIADAVEASKEMLAVAESWENGKPVRETLNADIPLVVDHFRYFAAAARAEEGRSTEIDKDLVAYHFREPLGVVGQIIPFNFPLLMAAWKLAPALAAGNCTVLKPASPTPWSILKLAEVIEDIVPPGVINIVTGPGAEIGKALAANPRIAKIAFTGETVTGRLIMQYAAQNIIPSTVELGGKSPNIFFADVMASDDDFLDKAVEGLVLYAFNKGEVCTCPSRALIQASTRRLPVLHRPAAGRGLAPRPVHPGRGRRRTRGLLPARRRRAAFRHPVPGLRGARSAAAAWHTTRRVSGQTRDLKEGYADMGRGSPCADRRAASAPRRARRTAAWSGAGPGADHLLRGRTTAGRPRPRWKPEGLACAASKLSTALTWPSCALT